MERHGRRERAQGEYQEASRHHHSSHKPSDKVSRPGKEVLTIERHQGQTFAKLPRDLLTYPLNGDSDYVQRWLAHTDDPTNHRELSERGRNPGQHERGEAAHVKPKYHLEPQDQGKKLPPTRKRKRHSSSDSSIIDVPRRSIWKVERNNENSEEKRREEVADDLKHKRTASSEGSSSDPFSEETPLKETFERRARHKTREDKYEPRKSKKKDKSDSKKQKSRKKNEKRRTAKTSGEDVMNKFSSKNVGQERLTIRPNQGLGLFNNGRASSPARRRGLSDLTFSEMNFLQNPSRQPQAEQKSKAKSKSREKEKRKATRAQEEITDFFRPNHKSLEEAASNRGRRASSPRSTEKDTIYVKQLEQQNKLHHYNDIRSLDSRERPLVALRQRNVSFDRSSIYRSVSPVINDPRKHCRSASKASEKATTYVSWSETQLSPPAPSRRQTIDRAGASPTPASVRRSLEDTGIFRDTGIGRNAEPKCHDHGAFTEHSSLSRSESNEHKIARHESGYSGDGIRSLWSLSEETIHPSKERPNLQARETSQGLKTIVPEDSQPKEVGSTRTRVIIEHFNPASGCYEAPKITPRCSSSDIPQESKKGPIDRQELGNAARIKRPATTLPLSRIPIQMAGQEHQSRVADKTANNNNSITQSNQAEGYNNQYAWQGNWPSRAGLERDEYAKTDYHAQDFEPNAHGHDFSATQQISNENLVHESSIRGIDTTSYLGLLVRGSWEPLQIAHNRLPTPMPARQPYFLHQGQQEEPMLNGSGTTCQDVTDYEIYNIPEEYRSPGLGSDGYEDVAYGDVVFEDPASYDAYMNAQHAVNHGEYENINHPGMDAHLPYNGYGMLEHYDTVVEAGEVPYEDDAILDEELLSEEELEAPFQVVDEYLYDIGAHEQTPGFWRPRMQY